jgi:hypothetical protein
LLPSNSDHHALKAGASKKNHLHTWASYVLSSSSTSTAAAAAAIEGFAAATLSHTYVELSPIMHDDRNTSLMELSVTIGGVNYATLLCYMFLTLSQR